VTQQEAPDAADAAPPADAAQPGAQGAPLPQRADPSDAPGTAERAPTVGDPRVDDALSRLAEVDALPLSEQVEVFTDIHRRLAAVLADPESRA
jgi:hypothetical protein